MHDDDETKVNRDSDLKKTCARNRHEDDDGSKEITTTVSRSDMVMREKNKSETDTPKEGP